MTTVQIIGYSFTYIGLAGFLLTMFSINKPIERHIEEQESHFEVDCFGALIRKRKNRSSLNIWGGPLENSI